MQAAPEFLESTVSLAVSVFRLRMIEEDLRLYKASSNVCAVLESKILLLRLRVFDYIDLPKAASFLFSLKTREAGLGIGKSNYS